MGLAVLAFVAFMWFRQTRWSGTVIDAAGKPIEGVTVLLINGQKVADITATEADGSYSLVVGMKPDPALRLMFCKVMYEASPHLCARLGQAEEVHARAGAPRHGGPRRGEDPRHSAARVPIERFSQTTEEQCSLRLI